MTWSNQYFDDLLAAVLRGDAVAWPAALDPARALDRILYHGIAGLVADAAPALVGWPASVTQAVREQGFALAMWELRHKAVVAELIDALADDRIEARLLKGTALAYDLYASPATRARGDSDLLVAPADLAAARSTLDRLGFERHAPADALGDDLALQEIWSRRCGAGTIHDIDLHWQLINAPALGGLMAMRDCMDAPLPLPRLSANARAMSRPMTLLHTCLHRAMHLTSPYFVDGKTYYGGDRLIWAHDIARLADALDEAEWRAFAGAAVAQGVGEVCRDGLAFAERTHAIAIPDAVAARLAAAQREPGSAYLLHAGQARRAWLDLCGIPGWRRRVAYVAARSVPSAGFMRGKYPELAHRPLALLHARRLVDLLRPRTGHEGRG